FPVPATVVGVCCYAWSLLRVLTSFPTRRSSDLWGSRKLSKVPAPAGSSQRSFRAANFRRAGVSCTWPATSLLSTCKAPCRHLVRSEEHTSELQSRENLVCRLLLEKKKVLRHSIK